MICARFAAVAALLCVSQSGWAQAPQSRSVEEYGLAATFPAGARVCEALTGGSHLHGWAMPIYGDCEQMRRRITIWADWNAGFRRSPEDALFCSLEDRGSLVTGARLRLAFPRRRSATCRHDEPDGRILVEVMTQAWRWPDWRTATDPDSRAPLVNYSAILRTTPATLDADLRAFRRVLASVRLTKP